MTMTEQKRGGDKGPNNVVSIKKKRVRKFRVRSFGTFLREEIIEAGSVEEARLKTVKASVKLPMYTFGEVDECHVISFCDDEPDVEEIE